MEEGQAFDSHWKKTMWACAALQAREVAACLGSQNVPFRNQGLYEWEQKKQQEHFKPGLLEMEPLPKHTTTLFSNHGDTRVEEEEIWLTEEITFVGEVGAGSETNRERESVRLYFAEFFHLKVSRRDLRVICQVKHVFQTLQIKSCNRVIYSYLNSINLLGQFIFSWAAHPEGPSTKTERQIPALLVTMKLPGVLQARSRPGILSVPSLPR